MFTVWVQERLCIYEDLNMWGRRDFSTLEGAQRYIEELRKYAGGTSVMFQGKKVW